MKRSEIHIDGIYTNGKGGFRMVTGEGNQFLLHSGQEDADCLEYLGWTTYKPRGVPTIKPDVQSWVGTGAYKRRSSLHHHITRTSFAAWAKRHATGDEVREVLKVMGGTP